MQSKRITSCGRLAGTVLSAFLLGIGSAQAEATHTFRANTVGDENSITYQGLERFAQIVEARSDGDISFSLHHSGALGDQVGGIESLQAGTIDVATVETPIDVIDPVLGATALPYLFRDREHVEQVVDGFYRGWAEEQLLKHDLRLVSLLEGGFRHITNDVRPIETPSNLEGITMRTPDSRLRVRTFEEYGADASPLPFSELYTALQTGTFDGQENPIIWVKTQSFYEVQDYLSLTGHVYTMTYVLMSEESYQKLSEHQKQIVKQAGKEAGDYSVEVGRQADQEVVDFLKEKGMKVNKADVESFVEQSRPIWDEWVEDLDPENQKKARMLIDLVADAGNEP